MSTRIHLVLSEEEKARLAQVARREGMTLSAWLRSAAEEKLRRSAPPTLSTGEELDAFFQACDERERGKEPDWKNHLEVMKASRSEGVPDP
jgi:hypothetical protein